MDVSDGLAGDLTKLCAASGISAIVDTPLIPASAAAAGLLARGVVAVDALFSGGDDYEILCAVPETRCAAFEAEARRAGVPLTSIGTIVEGSGPPRFLSAEGTELSLRRLSYSHF
jgi:thiamine-monophosphate kinase